MELSLSDVDLIDRLRSSSDLVSRYRKLASYFFHHGCAASYSLTEPLSDTSKQFFEAGARYLPYVLLADPAFLNVVTDLSIPDAAALKLQADLPGIGFDAKAYIVARNERIKAAEDAKKNR